MELTPSAHLDTFCRDNLPPPDQWPELLFELPELAYPDRLNCAHALLDETIERLGPDRRCLLTPTEQWSYGELRENADAVARVLTEDLDLATGNRVLLRGPNTPWLVACWLGVLKAGLVAVTTMPLLRAPELTAMHEISLPVAALCDHRNLAELERAATPGLTVLAYGGPGPDDLTARCAARRGRFTAVPTAADDVALIAFTSGTTGRPKATLHFHRDVLANADTFSRHVLRPTPDDLFAGTPPLAFTFGLGGLVVFPLRAGAAALLLERTGPEELAEHVARHRVSMLFTAPTAYRAILAAGLAGRLEGVRRCVSAGEHLPVSVWQAFHAATGQRLVDGIGATELLHVFISAADGDIRPGATGRPVPGYRAAVLDADGAPVPDGTPGLLAVKGPTGCRYLRDERQAGYVRNGWNLTGDTCVRDRDGYFWYQARTDDMIVSAGYNIAGPEVEQVLAGHPDVLDSAVVGAPDERRGSVVKAYVVLREGVPAGPETVRELQEHVKRTIAPYKYPREVEFVTELPRTATGKLHRAELRRRAAAHPASVAVERRVEWSDTDAAGHYHFSAVQRWVEAAEAVLLRRLGLAGLFGRIPRVHFEADYRERLWFGDQVRTELRVLRVGGSSLHYAFEVHGPQGLAAAGRMSVVHAAPQAKGTEPWPAEVRRALAESGPQQAEGYR
ncbi:2-aminobenzoate-CoA ligase [Streptomyces sp. CB01881]|nr:2-aminobenzoate-CoA ligase [Streptomyces sp. CB01881]TYC70384.1 2-aminobenzoate-CoA ligase [Streptomyces sp. CB01881]